MHQSTVRSARSLVARGCHGGYFARRALSVLRRFAAKCPPTLGTQIPYASASFDLPSPADAATVTSEQAKKQRRKARASKLRFFCVLISSVYKPVQTTPYIIRKFNSKPRFQTQMRNRGTQRPPLRCCRAVMLERSRSVMDTPPPDILAKELAMY